MVGGQKLSGLAVSRRYDGHVRFRFLALLVISLLTTVGFLAPASSAATDDLEVQITSISPAVLGEDATIILSGTATNNGRDPWSSVHAYMVMPRWPYTSRVQLHDVLTSDFAYVGERIVNTDRFATIGDLAPGQSKNFTIRVPSKELGLSAADGVYPVGVHLVATNSQGERDPQGQDRDLTLLPRLTAETSAVPAGLVWPFVETWSVDKPDADAIIESVTSGQMRRYLDAAKRTPTKARSLLIDPALLDSLESLALEADTVEDDESDDGDQAADNLRAWSAELLELSQESDTWIIDYGRPDYVGFAQSEKADDFMNSIAEASQDGANRHKLVGKKIFWPAAGDTTASLLSTLAEPDPELVVVSTDRFTNWNVQRGSRPATETDHGTVPVFATAPVQFSPSQESPSLFVQHTLSRATLASLERAANSSARSDALTLMHPRWDPQISDLDPLVNQLSPNADASFLRASTLSSLPGQNRSSVTVQKTTEAKSFSRDRLARLAELSELSELVTAVNLEPAANLGRDNVTEQLISLRWRGKTAQAMAATSKAISERTDFLNSITVDAPASITLSGQEGAFPLTIRNGSDAPVRVSLSLTADVPEITFDESPSVRIEPGASHTMTVSADMGTQVAATVSARLESVNGTAFGSPRAFVLRSSNVGQIVWIAMAFAVLLVVAAGIRRFVKKRNSTPSGSPEPGVESESNPTINSEVDPEVHDVE